MHSHTHVLQSISACTPLAAPALGARLSRQRCCGTQTVCRASQSSDVALLERPGMKKIQELPRPGSDMSRPAEWLEAKQGAISQHNQALLRWLDVLTEEIEACDAKVVDSELQQTVETALRMQAEDSTADRPVLQNLHQERKARRRQ